MRILSNRSERQANWIEVKWEGENYLVFKQKEYLALKLLPDHDVISSLFELSHEVKTWRHIGIGFAISFFALTDCLFLVLEQMFIAKPPMYQARSTAT